MAAALRVNGDTLGDDNLAELDDLTSGDLVATLAKIITGDTQDVPIEVHSFQQALVKANASLCLANTIIGEYQMMEDEPNKEGAVVAGGSDTRPPAGSKWYCAQRSSRASSLSFHQWS